jgi:hypothetical protein
MNNVLSWLKNSEDPWVRLGYLTEFENINSNDPKAISLKKEILCDPRIKSIINELNDWPGYALMNHKDSRHPLHKLVFLADIGLDNQFPEIEIISEKVMKRQCKEGPFCIDLLVPKHFGGTGQVSPGWALCDAPLIHFSLAKFGYKDDLRIINGLQHFYNLSTNDAWGCHASPNFPNFRGPGKKDDPCPYANLLLLKLFSLYEDKHRDKEILAAMRVLFSLWEDRGKSKPYLFGIGTDFNKLKAPLIWYNVLHFLDVLTSFPYLQKNKTLHTIVDEFIKNKKGEHGKFKPESIYKSWSDFCFGQKREPSPWLTFLIYRIKNRMDRIETDS